MFLPCTLRILLITVIYSSIHKSDADLVVGTSFQLPKVPDYTKYNFELKVGTDSETANSDEIGLKPLKPVQYSVRPFDRSYVSTEHYNPKGMEHLYAVTEMFLDFIQTEDIPPEIAESKSINDVIKKVEKDNGIGLMKHYVGMVAIVASGLLIALIIPLAGMIFCCCRCAGKCGGGREVVEKSSDVFKRAILGIFMFILVIVMMFGIVCAFVTNEYIEKGLKVLPSTFNSSIDDVQIYMRNTRNAVNSLLKDNYKELNARLDATLDRSGDIVKNRLGDATEAFAINNLTQIVSGLEKVRDELKNISQKTSLIQSLAADLHVGLTEKQEKLIFLFNECNRRCRLCKPKCDSIRNKYNIDSLSVTESFEQLPNVSKVALEISRLIQQDIVYEVKKGKTEFDDISLRIQREVQNIIPDIKGRISKVGIKLERTAENITKAINSINLKPLKDEVTKMHKFQALYGQYRWYVCIGMGSIILLVTLLLIFGMFCGICGKTPGNIYGDDSCNKGTGSNFMFMAISIIIMLSLFMMALNSIFFIFGGLSRQLFCHPIKKLDNPTFMKLLDVVLENEEIFKDNQFFSLKPSNSLHLCHQNKTIYDVLNLGSVANVSDIERYRLEFQVDEKIQEFLKKIDVNPDVKILSGVAKRQLMQLADSDLSNINFTTYSDKLQEKVTPVDIMELANELEILSRAFLQNRDQLTSQLRNRAIELQAYQSKYITKIRSTMALLRIDAQNLERDIKFNQTSFKEAIYYLIDTVEKAQKDIRVYGKQKVDNLARSFVQEFTATIDGYAGHFKEKVTYDIGKCWPVSQAINSSVSVACQEILLPFNGFWISMGWCLILWLPVLFLGASLSVLYRRVDPYAGALVESVEKKQRRKRRRADRDYYDGRNYVQDYTSMPSDGHNSDRRRRTRSNGYMPAPTSSEDTTPNTPRDLSLGVISSQTATTPPEYLEKPPPYYYHAP